MKRDLKTVRDLLAEKREARQKIYDTAVNENRSRTELETQQWNALGEEVRGLEEEEKFLMEGEELARRNATPIGVHHGESSNKDLSEIDQRDLQKFSIGRAVKRAYNRETIDGVEAEVIAEGRSEMERAGASPVGNVILPYQVFARSRDGRDVIQERVLEARSRQRRDVTATGGTNGDQGGVTIQTTVGRIYEALFNKLVLQSLGATFMPGMIGNLTLPRIIKGTSPGYVAEQGAAVEQQPTFAKSTLSPHRLPSFVDASNQLMRQSEMNVEQYLRNYLFSDLSSVFDKSGISGSGASNEPLGILATAGIGAVYAGGAATNSVNANGLALIWDDIVNLVKAIQVTNADVDDMAYLTNPLVTSKLQTTLKGSNTAAVYIMGEGAKSLNGYNVGKTNNVPNNITKGSSNNLSALIFGNFRDLWMATWGGIDLLVDPYTQAGAGTTRIHANLYGDCAVVRPESFSAVKDAVA